MKILCFLFILSSMAQAETLRLDRYDQLKLTELLARLPEGAKEEKAEKDDSVPGLQKIFMSFPKAESDFKIFCEAHYYHGSPYTSFSQCRVDVDLNGPSIEQNYDELKIKLSGESAAGLFESIPHGMPKRELRSWTRDFGTNFNGIRSEIFRYYFSCVKNSCEIFISEKGLTEN